MKFAPSKQKLEKTLHFIDIFGLESRFLIYGYPKFKTTLGGILTVVYISMLLLIFFSLSSNMIKRQNPDSSISEIYKGDPSPSKVGPDDYFFIFSLQKFSTWEHFYDPTIYTVSIQYGNKGNVAPFERCTDDHLPKQSDLNNFFKTAHYSNLSELLCIKKDLISNFDIRGDYAGSGDYNYFKISIKPCQNSTDNSPQADNVVCKPIDVIEDNIGKGYFALYSTDTLLDVMDYENPGKRVGLNYFIDTGLTLGKRITRLLATITLNSDNGWITDDIKQSEYTSFSKDRESFFLIKDSERYNSSFLEMDIRKSVYEKTYNRKYLKIQAVMAFMGGFLQIMFIGLHLLTFPIVSKQFHDKITNSTFNFEDDHKENPEEINSPTVTVLEETQRKLKPATPEFSNIAKKSKFHEIVRSITSSEAMTDRRESMYRSKRNSVNPKLEKLLLKELHKLEDRPMNLSMWQLFKSYFSDNSPDEVRKSQRLKGIKNIFQKLDIVTLLQKLSEIDKLKMILLDEDQYHLFHILPKPFIQKDSTINYSYQMDKHDQTVRKKSIFLEHDSLYTKTKMAQASLKNILKKQGLSVVDQKLISLISPEIKQIMMDEKFTGVFKVLDPGERDRLKKITEIFMHKEPETKRVEEATSYEQISGIDVAGENLDKVVIIGELDREIGSNRK